MVVIVEEGLLDEEALGASPEVLVLLEQGCGQVRGQLVLGLRCLLGDHGWGVVEV